MSEEKVILEFNKSELEILSKSLESYTGLSAILTINPLAIKNEQKTTLQIKTQIADLLKTRIDHELDKLNNYEEN